VWHVREPLGAKGEYQLIVGDFLTGHLFHKMSRTIICNSVYTASFFQQRGIPVQIITNGLNSFLFEAAEAKKRGCQLRRNLTGQSEGLVVGMVGNVATRWKGHKLFLEIAANLRSRFPDCFFVVFGSNSNLDITAYTRELKMLSEQLNLSDCLVWADFVEDIPAIMHSMDILVHPAANEGSGRVVMEAMAAGKPVVGIRSGGVQELIQDGITGFLVPPNDTQAMTDRTSFLLKNASERVTVGMKAARCAKENFSNQVMMQFITAVYHELI
jgi:glycosyltransferase involved in cell wall biosynthesis